MPCPYALSICPVNMPCPYALPTPLPTPQRSDPSNIVIDLRAHLKRNSIDLNALSIHPLHGHLLTVGGGDEFLRVADLRRAGAQSGAGSMPLTATCVARFCPEHLLGGGERSLLANSPHITGCQYNVFGSRIVATYSNDDVCPSSDPEGPGRM